MCRSLGHHTLRFVAGTDAPAGPTASTSVTPAKPLPVIVKSVKVLGLAVDPPVLVRTCGPNRFAEGVLPLSPDVLTDVVPK